LNEVSMNILIVNPFGIGDCLFATPLLHSLKDAFPDTRIGFLCNKRTAPLLKKNPFIDQLFIYERDEFKRLQSVSWITWLREFSRFIKSIQKAKFDLAIDLSLSTPFGFFLFLAGIKKRIGYNYKNRGMYLTRSMQLRSYDKKHMVEYYNGILDLLKVKPHYSSMELYLNEEDVASAQNLLREKNPDNLSPIIVIAPGGGASWGKEAYLKYWPAGNFKVLIDKILEKYNPAIIIVGDLTDSTLLGAGDSKVINCTGKLTLAQTAALIQKADLFIGNDGGLLHMAVALGIRTISFFGPVDPLVYGPYPQDPHRHSILRKTLECSPCYRSFRLSSCKNDRECLVKINVEDAINAIDNVLSHKE